MHTSILGDHQGSDIDIVEILAPAITFPSPTIVYLV